MSETSTKKINNNQLLKEENSLDWNQILKKIQLTLGSDVYDSWIKNKLNFINKKKNFRLFILLYLYQMYF